MPKERDDNPTGLYEESSYKSIVGETGRPKEPKEEEPQYITGLCETSYYDLIAPFKKSLRSDDWYNYF